MTDDVRQEERDRAADAVKAYRGQKNGNWQQRIRDGLCDDGEMVQAFARHASPLRARIAELEGALRMIADGHGCPMALAEATLGDKKDG